MFFTTALWFISWAMEANGSAHAWNPAWGFVKGVRDFMTMVAAVGICVPVVLFIVMQASELQTHRREDQKAHEDYQQSQIEREAAQVRREKEAAQALERKRIEVENRKQEYEERLKQEALRKKSRSAEAANIEALRDF